MINIVVYGKPRSFESHEYGFDDDNIISGDNSFPEPKLKPKNYNEPVLHYFAGNGYAGVECYTRAKGFESERDGLVFGVALKANHDFSVKDVIDTLLMPFLSDFASVLLDGDERFVCPSILDALNGTKWGSEEISTIRESVKQNSIPFPNKKICLLYAPEDNQIHHIESQLKEYSDVYISSNLDIFKDSINEVVLKLTGGVIHTIKDGTIVEIQESRKTTKSSSKKKEYNWGGNRRDNGEQKGDSASHSNDSQDGLAGGNGITNDDRGNGITNDDGGNGGNRKWPRALIIALTAILFVIILIAVLLIIKPANNNPVGTFSSAGGSTPSQSGSASSGASGSTTGAGSSTGASTYFGAENITVHFDPYPTPINQSLPLKLTWDSPLPLVIDDFKLEVDHPEIVEITSDNKLKVKSKPAQETIVTVTAKYKGRVCGSQTYKIAKKQSVSTTTSTKTPSTSVPTEYTGAQITFSRGNRRTIFTKGDHIQLYAYDKAGRKIIGGQWNWSPSDGLIYSGSINDNPIMIWCNEKKDFKITYKQNGKVIASTDFHVGNF